MSFTEMLLKSLLGPFVGVLEAQALQQLAAGQPVPLTGPFISIDGEKYRIALMK